MKEKHPFSIFVFVSTEVVGPWGLCTCYTYRGLSNKSSLYTHFYTTLSHSLLVQMGLDF